VLLACEIGHPGHDLALEHRSLVDGGPQEWDVALHRGVVGPRRRDGLDQDPKFVGGAQQDVDFDSEVVADARLDLLRELGRAALLGGEGGRCRSWCRFTAPETAIGALGLSTIGNTAGNRMSVRRTVTDPAFRGPESTLELSDIRRSGSVDDDP
jgi:hypothetical protein